MRQLLRGRHARRCPRSAPHDMSGSRPSSSVAVALAAALLVAGRWRAVRRAGRRRADVRAARDPHHVAARPDRHHRRDPHRRAGRRRAEARASRAVRFFVDDMLLGEDTRRAALRGRLDRRQPVRGARDSRRGRRRQRHIARDTVVAEAARARRAPAGRRACYVETSVQDKTGRFVTGMTAAAFQLFEDDVPQTLDVVRPRAAAGDLHPAHRQQPEHGAAHRLRPRCRYAAGRLPARRSDRIIVAPFAKTLADDHRADRRSHDGRATRSRRFARAAAPRFSTRSSEAAQADLAGSRGGTRSSCCHRRLRRAQQRRARRRHRQAMQTGARRCTSSASAAWPASRCKGERFLKQLAARYRRAGLFSVERDRAAADPRAGRVRSDAAVRADLHAEQPDAGRHAGAASR